MSVKLYINKFFELKGNNKTKYYFSEKGALYHTSKNRNNMISFSLSNMNNVLVLEENNKRVKILPCNAPIGWINKFYLKREIIQNTADVELVKAIDELQSTANDLLKDLFQQYEDNLEYMQDLKKLYDIVNKPKQ